MVGGPLEIGVLPAEDTPALAFLQEIADEMEADIPGTDITFTFANTLARPAIEQRWRAGDPLDIDYSVFDGTNENLLLWADEGFLLDLSPYVDIDRFNEGPRQFMLHPETGALYGVPSEISSYVLFYNKGMFDDLGISAPETWDEFLAVAQELKDNGIDPIAVSGLINFYLSVWLEHLWLRLVGYDQVRAAITRGEGTVLDHPGYLRGLEMVQELRDRDFFLEGFEGGDFTAVQAQFFQGEAGFILMGTWLASEMAEVIPDDFELGAVMFPQVTGAEGDDLTLLGAANMMSVSTDTANIPLAIEWINRLTDPEVQQRRADELGQTSAVRGVGGATRILGLADVLGQADSVQGRHFGILAFESGDVFFNENQRLLFGQQDAQETLDNMAKGFANLFG